MAKIKDIDISDMPVKRTLNDMSKEELIERINILESFDGLVAMFYANNRKLHEMAKSLNSFVLDVKEGDKSFTNYLALQKGYREMVEAQEWLKGKLGLNDEDIKQETQRALPPLELRNRQ